MTNAHDVLPTPPTSPQENAPTLEFFPSQHLLGAVLMIPNSHWGFEVVSAADHPGTCTSYLDSRRCGVLLQGTDADHITQPRAYHIVAPTAENGLRKHKAFRLVPRYFRLHRLRLYFSERHIGRLDDATLQTLRNELARLNPEI